MSLERMKRKMAKKPQIPHKVLVDFMLSGHSTRDAKNHFGFSSDNIANLRIWAAFKRMGLKRPIYAKERICDFCGRVFIARNLKQRTCGDFNCQAQLISDWRDKHPDKCQTALVKYRKTEKGRQNNIRMHKQRRRKKFGPNYEKWNFAADECKKSLRKLKYLAYRSPWEYRILHIQNLTKMRRDFNPRPERNIGKFKNEYSISSDEPISLFKWYVALRIIDTTIRQRISYIKCSVWEKTVQNIATSLRSSWRIRAWKQKGRQLYHLTTSGG